MVPLNILHLERFYRYFTFMHLFSTYLPIMFLPTCHEDYHALNTLWELLLNRYQGRRTLPTLELVMSQNGREWKWSAGLSQGQSRIGELWGLWTLRLREITMENVVEVDEHTLRRQAIRLWKGTMVKLLKWKL